MDFSRQPSGFRGVSHSLAPTFPGGACLFEEEGEMMLESGRVCEALRRREAWEEAAEARRTRWLVASATVLAVALLVVLGWLSVRAWDLEWAQAEEVAREHLALMAGGDRLGNDFERSFEGGR